MSKGLPQDQGSLVAGDGDGNWGGSWAGGGRGVGGRGLAGHDPGYGSCSQTFQAAMVTEPLPLPSPGCLRSFNENQTEIGGLLSISMHSILDISKSPPKTAPLLQR